MNDSKRRDSGASQQRSRRRDRLDSYLKNHKRVARESLQRLKHNPVSNLMTWLVIGIALALPGGLYVSLDNLAALSQSWGGQAHISLFLHGASSEQNNRQLAKTLRQRQDIGEVRYISAEQALAEFQRQSGFGDVLASLDDNPLPAVLVIEPADQHSEAVQQLFAELEQLPQAEQAMLDLAWIQRLQSIMELGQRLAAILAGLLAIGVLLVIGNTIRLAIENRRDEIIITKLVGGTDAFVRRPFLYTGLWYGLGGGLAAWFIILLALWGLSGPVAELTGLYHSEFALQGLGFGNSLLLWLGGAGLGLTGAWLAVSRHLGQIKPR